MPTLHSVRPAVNQKVNFTGQKPMKWSPDAMSALKEFEKGEGAAWKSSGTSKKVLGMTALLALAAGVALHKIPADKLPKVLVPAKEMVAKLATKLKDLVSKSSSKAKDVAEEAPKLLTQG